VTLVAVVTRLRSRTPAALRNIVNDALYRGSLVLLVNTVSTSAIGFVFWTLAARSYSASTVGAFSSVISGAGLLAAIAALGLPNTMIRHVVGAENSRELVLVAVTAIATVGTTLCLVTVLALGPHLPLALHLRQRGGMTLLVIALVVFTAVGGTLDAGLIATRSSHAVLIKNLIGSTAKVAALFLLTSFRSSGLLISYSIGLVLATALSGVALRRRLSGQRAAFRPFHVLKRHLSITSGNYLATIMGIVPVSVVPLEVLAVRGAAETARFAVAFLIAGFLNFIPSTVGQVLFAEASRQGVTLGGQLRKAIRGVYGLLLPALVIMVAAAPLLLRLFGAAYAAAATGCLRVLALSALLTGGTYLVDSLLIARDRIAAYVFMNGANAALVLVCVGMLLPRGLTAAAGGWALAQGLSLLLGLLILASGTVGRHHPKINPAPAGDTSRYPRRDRQPQPLIHAFEPQIRELLATWPMMPTSLIAQSIGWGQPTPVLLDRVTELRSAYSDRHQGTSRASYLAGETAQCGLWFPPVEVPVGFGQQRSAQQLPVLTMITGYSRWLSAVLIPSRHVNDMFAGLWELLAGMGAIPHLLTWDSESAIGRCQAGKAELTNECEDFCGSLGTDVTIGRPADPDTRGLIEQAHVYLERSFLPGRSFAAPMDFNAQLRDWQDAANTRPRKAPDRSPAELIDTDRQAMLPLPSIPPATGWHLSIRIGSHPFFRFDSNEYSVHPDVVGHRLEVVADLSQITARCDGKVAACHDRAWARGRVISDPAHAATSSASPR
jgi:O-antigen/teichoic acid export membrane protein